MPDRFDHDPVARLEAAKAAHRSMFTGDPGNGPRTTAIEDVLIAQLVEARAERDRYEAALFKIVELWQDRADVIRLAHIAEQAEAVAAENRELRRQLAQRSGGAS